MSALDWLILGSAAALGLGVWLTWPKRKPKGPVWMTSADTLAALQNARRPRKDLRRFELEARRLKMLLGDGADIVIESATDRPYWDTIFAISINGRFVMRLTISHLFSGQFREQRTRFVAHLTSKQVYALWDLGNCPSCLRRTRQRAGCDKKHRRTMETKSVEPEWTGIKQWYHALPVCCRCAGCSR